MPERIAVAHRPQEGAADIFKNAHFGKNVGDLETAAKTNAVDLMRLLVGYDLVSELDVSGRYFIKSADEVEKRRFAGAVGTDDCVPFVFNYIQVDPVNYFAVAEAFMDINQLECDFRHYRIPFFIS